MILVAACAVLLASISLVGQLRSTGGTVELGEDGKWYYGTFIPKLEYGRQGGGAAAKRPNSPRESLESAAAKIIGGAGSKGTKLDDLPIPNLEPGTDSTPDYPMPDARRSPRQTMLEDAQNDHNYSGEESFVTDDDWDNSAALEGAGINVHKGFESKRNDLFGDHVMTEQFATVHPASGAPIFYDRNVPVEEVDDSVPRASPRKRSSPEIESDSPFDQSPATEYPTDPERAEIERNARIASRHAAEESAPPLSKSGTQVADGLDMHHSGGAVSHSSSEPAGHLNAIGLKGKESQLWQVAKSKTSKLYVDASSPDYFEPQVPTTTCKCMTRGCLAKNSASQAWMKS